MRTPLRTALLLALLGAGLTAVESPQAIEKADARMIARNKALAHRSVSEPAKGSIVGKPASIRLASHAAPLRETRQLAVQSGSALVIEQGGGDPLFQKNANAIAPIASITKLMTAMVVLDSEPNLQTTITIADDDVDLLRGSRSRLHVGAAMTRETALLLALMSSENRAANALARHYPGGMPAFLAAMNVKAQALGMGDTRFEDPTGLTSNNVSTAHDLAKMVAAAYRYPLIRQWSTMPEAFVEVGGRRLGRRPVEDRLHS
jgi:D-alanyl-D-alanine endopeptidase (penicillin-binding protein 7)